MVSEMRADEAVGGRVGRGLRQHAGGLRRTACCGSRSSSSRTTARRGGRAGSPPSERRRIGGGLPGFTAAACGGDRCAGPSGDPRRRSRRRPRRGPPGARHPRRPVPGGRDGRIARIRRAQRRHRRLSSARTSTIVDLAVYQIAGERFAAEHRVVGPWRRRRAPSCRGLRAEHAGGVRRGRPVDRPGRGEHGARGGRDRHSGDPGAVARCDR